MLRDYFKHKTVWITLLIVIAVMIAIFMFSSETREESTDTSDLLVNLFINLFEPDYEALSPEQQAAFLDRITNTIRKLAHFTEFAALGFFLTLHINELNSKLNMNVRFLWCAIIGIAYAISDELHQFFVPGRGPGIKDVLIDSLGVVTGLALMFLILTFVRKIYRKRMEK